MAIRKRLAELYRQFTSMRGGMTLLAVVTVLSLVGTVTAFDIYHSSVFRVTVGLLCCNLLFCSARRLQGLLRTVRGNRMLSLPLPLLDKGGAVERVWQTKRPLASALDRVERLLRLKGFVVQRNDEAGLYAVKGRMAAWGAFAVHVAILLIVGGATYGQVYGFSRDIVLPVGGVQELQVVPAQAPLQITLHDFKTIYYADGSVADWISDVSVQQGTQPALRQDVKVNQPLRYAGIHLYQMSYGNLLQMELLDANGAVKQEGTVAEQEWLVGQVDPELLIKPIEWLAPRRIAYVAYYRGQPLAWGVAELGERISLGKEQGALRFVAVLPYAGLQVKHDPGLPLVWSGFLLLTGGFFISLYSRSGEIWLYAAGDGQYVWRQSGKENKPAMLNAAAQVRQAKQRSRELS